MRNQRYSMLDDSESKQGVEYWKTWVCLHEEYKLYLKKLRVARDQTLFGPILCVSFVVVILPFRMLLCWHLRISCSKRYQWPKAYLILHTKFLIEINKHVGAWNAFEMLICAGFIAIDSCFGHFIYDSNRLFRKLHKTWRFFFPIFFFAICAWQIFQPSSSSSQFSFQNR